MAKDKKKKDAWYKKKNYLHFDLALKEEQAEAYVTNPKNILSHRFSPLIHYKKLSTKVQRDKAAELKYKKSGLKIDKPKLLVKRKKRNIFYSSHIDGYIYSYYSKILEERYEQFLLKNKLEENVIAYRAVEKNSEKFSNINFAEEVFDFVRKTKSAKILCFDVSKFFDKMSKRVLKENWITILEDTTLPPDHYRVYKSVTNFSYVDEGAIIQNFKDRFKINPRNHGLDVKTKGSFKHRICEYSELRELHKQENRSLIKNQSTLGITGIAQGTAISGMLSNIFMIEFDLLMKTTIEKIGGCYRRYSDDIFICVENIKFEDIINLVESAIKNKCGNSIKLNSDKTELRSYENINGIGQIKNEKGLDSRIQYLGFHFDGQRVHIRTSSMSKDRGKTIQTIRKYKDSESGINSRVVYKKRSPRLISKYDNEKKKGFAYYAIRARKIHDDSISIGRQFVKKNDAFIKASIEREKQIDQKKLDKKLKAQAYRKKENMEKRAKNKTKKLLKSGN